MLKQRSVSEQDRTKIEQWIQADDDHRGKCKPDFWLETKKGVACRKFGESLFVRAENVLRLHIQFSPDKFSNAKALLEFIPQIEESARNHGYTQIIWDSTSEPLIKFAERFGYRRSQSEIVKDL